MKIYLDYIFFENLIVNFFISFQIPIFCKFKIKRIRCFISSVVLSFYAVLVEIINSNLLQSMCVKLLLILIFVYISYNPKTIILYIKYSLCYIMFYYIYIGIIIFIVLFFKVSIDNYLVKLIVYFISGMILILINKLMWKMWKNNIKNKITYNIKIKNLVFKAFVDTGNNVKDIYNNLDVLFVSSKIKDKILKENKDILKTELKIRTAISDNNMEGYIIKNVEIYDNDFNINIKKIVMVFIDEKIFEEKIYSGLISYDTYIEKLKGATLC